MKKPLPVRRNCVDVIRYMLKHVPDTSPALRLDLEWNLGDASYKAPEQNIQWARTQQTLIKHIDPQPVEDWEFEVISIFTTKSIEELRESFKEINDGQ